MNDKYLVPWESDDEHPLRRDDLNGWRGQIGWLESTEAPVGGDSSIKQGTLAPVESWEGCYRGCWEPVPELTGFDGVAKWKRCRSGWAV